MAVRKKVEVEEEEEEEQLNIENSVEDKSHWDGLRKKENLKVTGDRLTTLTHYTAGGGKQTQVGRSGGEQQKICLLIKSAIVVGFAAAAPARAADIWSPKAGFVENNDIASRRCRKVLTVATGFCIITTTTTSGRRTD
ncbi:unnamed protein product [Ceratitis capitata]|uniref:(Mediterranean fruit fly) hypothetical protein n=1 Tax=Ceratitis capitata TaxID=7213 RepID=A0A811V364_CERCA|nr:unnamed protein product [Ceratitis capitata]